MIDETLAESAIEAELRLAPDEGADLAWAYANGDVLKRTNDAKGRVKLKVAIVADALPKFERRFGARLVRTTPDRVQRKNRRNPCRNSANNGELSAVIAVTEA